MSLIKMQLLALNAATLNIHISHVYVFSLNNKKDGYKKTLDQNKHVMKNIPKNLLNMNIYFH